MEIKGIKIQSLKNENPSLILNKDDFHSYNQNGRRIRRGPPRYPTPFAISLFLFYHILTENTTKSARRALFVGKQPILPAFFKSVRSDQRFKTAMPMLRYSAKPHQIRYGISRRDAVTLHRLNR